MEERVVRNDEAPGSKPGFSIEYNVIIFISIKALLAEWSKAVRSGRTLSGGVGSNPTECN